MLHLNLRIDKFNKEHFFFLNRQYLCYTRIIRNIIYPLILFLKIVK